MREPDVQAGAVGADDVLALLRREGRPLEAGRVPLREALGCVLREAVRAPEDQPAFDRSSVDGYAVRLDDPSASFRVVDEIRAGDWKRRRLERGQAVRIATGGALPGEDLRVVMREDVRIEGDLLVVSRREEGRNIRFRGEDARAGQVLVEPGQVLRPGTLALLASVGEARPWVTRRPRVRHVATGNELVSPDQTPARGEIRDSNSTLVRAFLAAWPIELEQSRSAEDETTTMTALTGAGSPGADIDLLLISGGASVGDHDFTRRLLERLGFTILVSKTTARPGKPLVVARRGTAFAFGLPGNPLAHFVCLNLYVRALLDTLSGLAPGAGARFQPGRLAVDLAGDRHERETFWPGHRVWEDGMAAITPLPWRSSGDLTPLAAANALIRVAAGTGVLVRGSRVDFLPTEGAA